MKVQNRKCIRRLSLKSLWASRKRNMIAIVAIALTTLLFTSLFTIAMSLNSNYQEYTFRQMGGYNHASFKEVTKEQINKINEHPKIKKAAARTVIGFCSSGVFAKVPAEVSYSEKEGIKWMYSTPTVGRMAEGIDEITMDTKSMELLGLKRELNQEVTLTYDIGDKTQKITPRTDTFKLVGYWEYDDISPVHYLNISKEYAELVQKEVVEQGYDSFRTDLNIMLDSSMNIEGQMEKIEEDLGYQSEDRGKENYIRFGVNWGYTSSQLAANFDVGTLLAIIAFALLVIFTGYLIIYNIFQISVTGDIRFYGLLKTIGVTPRQLKRIIYQQALFLCVIGIPIGLLSGYGVGAILTPQVLKNTTISMNETVISTSPIIFIGATLFSIITVLLSCMHPGHLAAKVSPIEATKYTEVLKSKKKNRATRGAKIHQMAIANLGRNKKKTVLVITSLSLSVVLLTILYSFVNSFDMEKYLNKNTCADFIVGTTKYFRFEGSNSEAALEDSVIEEIKKNTESTLNGCAYGIDGARPVCWMEKENLKEIYSKQFSGETLENIVKRRRYRGNLAESSLQIEGLDKVLFEKLEVVDGELAPLFEKDSHAIAIVVDTDDYGNIRDLERYPKVGDKFTVTYMDDYYYIDTRTGEKCDSNTPEEFIQGKAEKERDIDYTVAALIKCSYSMSFRFGTYGYSAVLPVEKLKADSKQDVYSLFYLFDTENEEKEAEAEEYLADLTKGDLSELMYESKKLVREEFEQFRQMFTLLGGLLCFIIGMVGILNFFNAIMTGILSRRHEFAVLQAIGLTNKQLKRMLIYEGLLYTVGAILVSLLLGVILGPLAGRGMGTMFWFFTYRFTILPVVLVAPIFAILGWAIPTILYRSATKQSVVERLREAE